VDLLREELAAWMAREGFPGETAYKAVTVVDELFCNTMEYSGATWCKVEAEIQGTDALISLSDDGVAFDPFEAGKKDYSLYLASDTDRRLGLYLVGRLARSIDYQREAGVNLVRFLVPADPPDTHRFEKKH
jgi:anti-sigma regulatory factor (Ser/Thr protein kinase)